MSWSGRWERTLAMVGAGVALLLIASPGLLAQDPPRASLVGTVTDPGGTPQPAVRVELLQIESGLRTERITSERGTYEFDNVEAGTPLILLVRAAGFVPRESDPIELEPGERRRIDMVLTPIEFRLDEVGVIVNRRFDPRLSGPAIVVTREEVRAHPTLDRNLLELATLSPVVAQTSDGGELSISGQNERHNSILVDGSMNQDVFGASPSGVPGAAARAKPLPMDAIEQFQIEAAPFDVGVSGFTGGVINATTRSGTNDWEGSLFSEFRNQHFFGGLELDGFDMAPEQFRRHVWGFNVGGPIRRDRAHLFVATEFEDRSEPSPGFVVGAHDPLATGVFSDSIGRMAEVLAEQYGRDPGTSGQVSLRNPIRNVFSRLDVNLSETRALTLRYNYSGAARDSTPNRAPVGPYEFSSAGYRAQSASHGVTARLSTSVGGGHENHLTANLQQITEEARPASRSALVDVTLQGAIEGAPLSRVARSGSRYFSQHNELQQTIVQVSNRLVLDRGDHRMNLGAGLDYFSFDQDFRPGSRGYYRFDDLVALEQNRPSYYEVNLAGQGGSNPGVHFAVAQPHLFWQNVHEFPDGLILSYGARLDLPIFRGNPAYNPAVDDAFGLRTDQLPSVTGTFSPRLGFNWQPDGTLRTQFRGTFGIFTANLPYVWMADAIRHNGLQGPILTCSGDPDYVPPLDPSARLPDRCPDARGEQFHRRVVGFRDDFRLPRELKVTMALDQELPGGLVLTTEGLFIPTFSRTAVRDLNLPGPGGASDAGYSRAFGDRAHYGFPLPTGYGFDRRVEDFSQVLQIENEKRAALAWGWSVQLERDFADWLTLTGSLSLSRTRDEQSLSFGDMATNLAATPIGRIASQYPARSANFDRPRKFLLSARLRAPERMGGGRISVVYTGQSGQPYSYVYNSDINGDGFPGPGIPLNAGNDLLFVPEDPLDIPATLPTRQLFAQFVTEVEPCLSHVRGAIMRRNQCRTPMTHMLDLSLTQPVTIGGARLEVSGNLLNALNLLRSEWGRVWEVDPVVPILDIVARSGSDRDGYDPSTEPLLGFTGPRVRDPASGEVRPTLPHNLVVPASQWQAQAGIRVFF